MPTATKSTRTKKVPVLVTTQHKGVFFGFAAEAKPSKDKDIRLEKAQLCIYWSTDVKGFMGLAATGPSKNCKIGPAVPAITLTDVTSVSECTADAAKAWAEQGERKWG